MPTLPGAAYRVQALPAAGPRLAAATAWLELAGGRTTAVTLQLIQGALTAAGSGSIAGSVLTPAGVPVAAAESDADGLFRFTGVLATRSGSAPVAQASGYVLKVAAAGHFETTLAARRSARRWSPSPSTRSRRLPPAGRQTATAGRWTAEGLDPLRLYRVEGELDGYRSALGRPLAPDPAAPAARDLALHPSGVLVTGRVSGPFGRPLPGALVTARGSGGEHRVEADAGGYYRLGLPAGEAYLLTASLGGHLSAGPDALLAPAPGKAATAAFHLQPAAAQLAGSVTLPGAALDLVREGYGAVGSTVADSQGRYRFTNLVPGARYSVRAAGAYRQAGNPALPPLITDIPGTVHWLHLELQPPSG